MVLVIGQQGMAQVVVVMANTVAHTVSLPDHFS